MPYISAHVQSSAQRIQIITGSVYMNKGIGGASNTRPERANEIGLRALVDWLSITFQVSEADHTQITQFHVLLLF